MRYWLPGHRAAALDPDRADVSPLEESGRVPPESSEPLTTTQRPALPFPDFTVHLVGTFEIICGVLVTTGLFTRLANAPLLVINLTTVPTTELLRPKQGFWFAVSEARTHLSGAESIQCAGDPTPG